MLTSLKQREIKLKPRMKLNHNSYTSFKRIGQPSGLLSMLRSDWLSYY